MWPKFEVITATSFGLPALGLIVVGATAPGLVAGWPAFGLDVEAVDVVVAPPGATVRASFWELPHPAAPAARSAAAARTVTARAPSVMTLWSTGRALRYEFRLSRGERRFGRRAADARHGSRERRQGGRGAGRLPCASGRGAGAGCPRLSRRRPRPA